VKFVKKALSMKIRPRPDGSLGEQTVSLWPDAAKALGISKNHAYAAAKSGEIPVIRIGRRIRVSIAVLDKMLSGEWKPKPSK
jgi:excisionase family DNA binding protein